MHFYAIDLAKACDTLGVFYSVRVKLMILITCVFRRCWYYIRTFQFLDHDHGFFCVRAGEISLRAQSLQRWISRLCFSLLGFSCAKCLKRTIFLYFAWYLVQISFKQHYGQPFHIFCDKHFLGGLSDFQAKSSLSSLWCTLRQNLGIRFRSRCLGKWNPIFRLVVFLAPSWA